MGTPFLVALVVVVLLVAWAVVAYNGLVAQRVRVQRTWSTVDAHLKRRCELVGDIVDTVIRCGVDDSETLDAVTSARARAMAASRIRDRARAESELTEAHFALRGVAERHPALEDDRGFARLQDDMTTAEKRIARVVQRYNDTVTRYEAKRRVIPTKAVAAVGDFPSHDAFEADVDSRTPVQVHF